MLKIFQKLFTDLTFGALLACLAFNVAAQDYPKTKMYIAAYVDGNQRDYVNKIFSTPEAACAQIPALVHSLGVPTGVTFSDGQPQFALVQQGTPLPPYPVYCTVHISDTRTPPSEYRGWLGTLIYRWYCPNLYEVPDNPQDLSQFLGLGPDMDCIPCNTCAIANPVNPGTGEKLHNEVDLQTAGAHPLTFTRSYRSLYAAAPDGSMGARWMHNYMRRLEIIPSYANMTQIIALRGDATPTYFKRGSMGDWITLASSNAPRDTITPSFAPVTYGTRPPTISDTVPIGWVYKIAETDTQEVYDVSGKLQRIIERNGWTTTLTYSTATTPSTIAPAAGLLIEIRNHFGRKLRLSYDTGGLLTRVYDPANNYIEYSYSGTSPNTVLSHVRWQDNTQKTYHYEHPTLRKALTGITDEAGVRYSTYTYDGIERVISETKAGGVDRYNFSYNNTATSVGAPSQIQTLSPTGVVTGTTNLTFTLGSGGYQNSGAYSSSTSTNAVPSYPAATTRNTAGQVIKETAADNTVTTYTYDTKGRKTSTRKYASLAALQAGTAALFTYTTTWHATWNLPVLETAPDRVISYAYDIYGNVTGHAQYETADRTGNALSSATAGVVPLQTGKTFNSRRLLAIATFSGTGLPSLTFNYTYDSYGNMSTHTQATAVFNGQAASTKTATFTVFDGWGNALNGRNLEGAMFTHTYDTRGRNTLLRIVSVTGLVSQSTMQYDAIGQLFRMSFPQTQSNGQIIQRLQQNTYNTAQQLIRTTLDGSQIWPELNPQPNNLLFEFKTSIFLNDLFAPIKNTDAQKTTIISSGSITCSGSDCISPPLCPTNSGGVGVCPDALERPKPKRDFKDLCEPYPKMKKTCEFCVQIACAFAKPTCCKIQNDKCLSDSQGEISAVTQCNVQQGLCLIR